MLIRDPAFGPPSNVDVTTVAFNLVTVTVTIFVFWISQGMLNANAAITAARMTVIATIRITPITGDTASTSFLVNALSSNPLDRCPFRTQHCLLFLFSYR
jgi:hypothetical protein